MKKHIDPDGLILLLVRRLNIDKYQFIHFKNELLMNGKINDVVKDEKEQISETQIAVDKKYF